MARTLLVLLAVCLLAPSLATVDAQLVDAIPVPKAPPRAHRKHRQAVSKKKAVVVKKRAAGPVVRIPPPVVTCQTTPQNPPFKSTSCQIKSVARYPLCVQLKCSPNPGGPCPTGKLNTVQNRECAWAVNMDCTSPAPLMPGSTWGWGMMTSGGQDPVVAVSNWTIVSPTTGLCPTDNNQVQQQQQQGQQGQ